MYRSLKVILRVIDACNLNCEYCYVSPEARRNFGLRLNLGQMEKVYRTLLSDDHYDHIHFCWHGGEPTFVGSKYLDQLIKLQSACKQGEITIENSIQTNATLLDDDMIEMLLRNEVGIGISMDAPPTMHDMMRHDWAGNSSLDRVLDGVQRLRSHGISVGAICVLHRHNYQLGNEIYDYFKSIGMGFVLNPYYRDEGGSRTIANEIGITAEQYSETMIELFDRYIYDDNPVNISDIKEIIFSMFTGRSRNCMFAGSCQDYIGILPDGQIYLCDHFYREESFVGTIEGLSVEMVKNSKAAQCISQRSEILQQTECKGCEWWNICNGGCASKAGAIYGNTLRSDPFCLTRKKLFSHIRQTLANIERKEVMKCQNTKS